MVSEPPSMPEKLLKIEFNKEGKPYNSRLTLDLTFLKELMPLLQPEILKGLVDTSGEDLVILHLNLTSEKILVLNDVKRKSGVKKIA